MLLLLPYRDRSIAANLPVVTILLAIACLLGLAVVQGRDAEQTRQAEELYVSSGLADIELPRYRAYLAQRNDAQAVQRLRRLDALAPGDPRALGLLQADRHFVGELHAQRVVAPSDPVFATWHGQRARLDELLRANAVARFGLDRADAAQAWRFVTYGFLHAGYAHLLGNLLVLLLVGPFVEAALGRLRYVAAYLAGGAAAGALQLVFSDLPVIGASGAIAATVGMLAVLYGTRRVPVFYWVFFIFGTARIPALALLPVWLVNEGLQWLAQSRAGAEGGSVAYAAHIGGLLAGALLARWLRPPAAAARAADPAARKAEAGSSLAAQAQEAAARLDIRRATRLYQQLVELEPGRTDYLGAYLNVALLGPDEETLRDAALRLLWTKFRKPTDELRRTFLQLAQDKVLKALPVDEQLRLARRLVKFREDVTALRVIDALLRDDHMRATYGRQLADCLLGLFTAYARHGLQRQADQISTRLSTYFPRGSAIGGEAPANRPPPTLVTMFRNTTPGFGATQPLVEPGAVAGPAPPGGPSR